MWRAARPEDDDRIVAMCMALYREDPAGDAVEPEDARRTLEALRREPARGRAVVIELDGAVSGYGLLISFWSNELGGEVCDVDELYVERPHRGQGHASRLLEAIRAGELWPGAPRGIALIVTDRNVRARRLYERLGLRAAGTTMVWKAPRR